MAPRPASCPTTPEQCPRAGVSRRGGYRDRNNVERAFRRARAGTPFEWVVPHTYRKTVATLLDHQGLSARTVADQLGHSRISMTQDVYMGRRAVGVAAAALERIFDETAGDPEPGRP